MKVVQSWSVLRRTGRLGRPLRRTTATIESTAHGHNRNIIVSHHRPVSRAPQMVIHGVAAHARTVGPARAPTVLINIKKRLLAARTATSLALGWGQRKSALRHPRGYSTAGRSGQGTARSFNQARPPSIVNCGRVMRLCVCMAERETKQQDKLPAAPSSVAHYWVDLFANKPFPRRLLQGASPFDR